MTKQACFSRTSSVSRLRSAPASTSWSLSSPRTDSHSDHIVRIVSVMNRQSSSLSGGGWLGLRIFGAELAASFGAAFAEATRQDVNTRAEAMSEEAHEVAYNGVRTSRRARVGRGRREQQLRRRLVLRSQQERLHAARNHVRPLRLRRQLRGLCGLAGYGAAGTDLGRSGRQRRGNVGALLQLRPPARRRRVFCFCVRRAVGVDVGGETVEVDAGWLLLARGAAVRADDGGGSAFQRRRLASLRPTLQFSPGR